MKKIIVIGCPGSGKSTFSKALHQITGIPLFHLDMLYWNADKTTVEKAVFMDRIASVLSKPSWILDGNYASTMEMRMQACDTIIFLDYPTSLCLEGVRQRKGKPRSDMPWVEPMGDDEEFIRFIENYSADSRVRVMELLKKYADKNIIIFQNRDEADAFLKQLKL